MAHKQLDALWLRSLGVSPCEPVLLLPFHAGDHLQTKVKLCLRGHLSHCIVSSKLQTCVFLISCVLSRMQLHRLAAAGSDLMSYNLGHRKAWGLCSLVSTVSLHVNVVQTPFAVSGSGSTVLGLASQAGWVKRNKRALYALSLAGQPGL